VRVGLDLQLARGTATGIGEYALGLYDALVAEGIDVVPLRSERLDPWRFDRRVLWDQALLPLAARRARVDLLHCASGTMPFVSPAPMVVTVHDVAWLRVQAHTRAYARVYFGAFALARYRRARRILVDSHFSREELLAVAPGIDPARVEVVYPGVSADFANVVRAPDGEAPFALVTGTVERRKNFEVLIRALPAVPRLRLISVGPATPYREECLQLARDLGVLDRVEIRGYVSRAELLSLYARATFAAAPSRYEGFGYAAAQALCAGVPLAASDAASLPEVVADAWPCLDPDAIARWSDCMRAFVAGGEAATARAAGLRARSVRRFAWNACARSTVRAYAAAL
jgi:glycosyltransferase involved in cell wall biosynthesis